MRAAGARVTMTPRELDAYWNWSGTDAELNNWFFGRMLAKDAARAAWVQKHGEAIFPADMETEDAGGRIVCRPRGAAKSEPFPPVSVAIADGKVAAFSAFADRVGIALLSIAKNANAETEREARTQVACAAVADALRVPAGELHAEIARRGHRSRGRDRKRAASFRVQTARQKDAVVATTICEDA